MGRFIVGLLAGAAAAYGGVTYYGNKDHQGLSLSDYQAVHSYLYHHKLEKLLKQSVMNGYMQFNRAFLDFGLKTKLEGFSFYGTYFFQEEILSNSIRRSRCVFSPREQLCGHPDIQHGGATATIIDQNSGMLAMLYSKELCATAELEVKYKKPVKRGTVYVWEGQVHSREDRKIDVRSVLKELETGSVCAEGRALMMTVQWQHKMAEVFHLLFRADSTPAQND